MREGAGAARGALPLPPPPPRREADRGGGAWGSPPGLALPRRPGSALGDERPAGGKAPPPPGLRAAGATPPGSGSRGGPSGAVLANADFLGDLRRLAQVFPSARRATGYLSCGILGILRGGLPTGSRTSVRDAQLGHSRALDGRSRISFLAWCS